MSVKNLKQTKSSCNKISFNHIKIIPGHTVLIKTFHRNSNPENAGDNEGNTPSNTKYK